jgi:hypothetical protein
MLEQSDMGKLAIAGKKYEVPERRREARLHLEFPVTLKLLSVPHQVDPPREIIECVSTNISLSGTRLALATYNHVEIGTVAKVRIKCGLLKTFTFTGTARNVKRSPWSPVCFVGFEITSDSTRIINAWRRFIGKHFRVGSGIR